MIQDWQRSVAAVGLMVHVACGRQESGPVTNEYPAGAAAAVGGSSADAGHGQPELLVDLRGLGVVSDARAGAIHIVDDELYFATTFGLQDTRVINKDGSGKMTVLGQEWGTGRFFVSDEEFVYWKGEQRLQRRHRKTGEVSTLAEIPHDLRFAGLEIDETHVYFADNSCWYMGKVRKDGSGVESVVPKGIANTGGATMASLFRDDYVCANSDGRLFTWPRAGGAPTYFDVPRPRMRELLSTPDALYWMAWQLETTIGTLDIAEQSIEQLAVDKTCFMNTGVFDPERARIFLTSTGKPSPVCEFD
jgi:hypothetical protein